MIRRNLYFLICILIISCSDDSDAPQEQVEINLPSLSTTTATSVTDNSATLGGNITDDGAGVVTERGVVWNTESNPTTANNKGTAGTGSGEFSITLSNLERSTRYFARAYAINSEGTAYGNEVSFTTAAVLATILTKEVTAITENSAITGGEIADDGGSEIISKGVCWSTSPNPTNEDRTTEEGNGASGFDSELLELEPNTQYYVRAFVENEVGIAYGNELEFTTAELPSKVFEGDVVLKTQQEVEDFGKANYIGVSGSLIIEGNSSIVDLSPLLSLQTIGGRLLVECDSLLTLKGLDNIEEAGAITLHNNNLLKNTSDLKSLKAVSNTIWVVGNDNLESLSGFKTIKELDGYFHLFANQKLLDLDGLQSLENIGGYLRIENNRGLQDISALSNLKHIGGFLTIKNTLVPDLTGFDELEFVAGFIEISLNDNLQSIDTFNRLISIEALSIIQNIKLEFIRGFNKLSKINFDLSISSNNALRNVNGFENVEAIEGSLGIAGNELEDLSGFNLLEEVGGNIGLANAEKITDLTDFANLSTVGGSLFISGNNSLQTLQGIDGLKQLGGDITIEFNRMLSDFCALQTLLADDFTGEVDIRSNFPGFNPTIEDIINGNCSN